MDNRQRKVLVIAGPTAAGKTAVSLALAAQYPIEIVCADSRQIYRGMDIGTAKPTQTEQNAVRHHCVNICEPGEVFNAWDYAVVARECIHGMSADVLPVVVGGSGLYIKAAFDGLSPAPPSIPEIRAALEREFQENGIDILYAELMESDPIAAARYADKNPRRVMRALEVLRATGRALSLSWQEKHDAPAFTVTYTAITHPAHKLKERINERCRTMWISGLLRETETLLQRGISPHDQCMQTVGYKEAVAYLNNTYTEDEALNRMMISTWQYAKRQLTWFRKDTRYEWFEGDTEEVVHSMKKRFVI